MESVTAQAARRPRAFVRVQGPQAGDYLQRMVSNDVLALAPGESCEALLLTPKARVVATLVVLRLAEDDYLLLTEPDLGGVVREHLSRMRFAARCTIEEEQRASHVRLGAERPSGTAVPTHDYGVPAWEVLGEDVPAAVPLLDDVELERLRIQAGTPRFGLDIDDRVLPAEAGLDERAISFTKGCYPGQEPIARLRYRGHANRSLRVLRLESGPVPSRDAEVHSGERAVGRVTSAVPDGDGALALAYVREEVPDDAVVTVQGATATMTRPRP